MWEQNKLQIFSTHPIAENVSPTQKTCLRQGDTFSVIGCKLKFESWPSSISQRGQKAPICPRPSTKTNCGNNFHHARMSLVQGKCQEPYVPEILYVVYAVVDTLKKPTALATHFRITLRNGFLEKKLVGWTRRIATFDREVQGGVFWCRKRWESVNQALWIKSHTRRHLSKNALGIWNGKPRRYGFRKCTLTLSDILSYILVKQLTGNERWAFRSHIAVFPNFRKWNPFLLGRFVGLVRKRKQTPGQTNNICLGKRFSWSFCLNCQRSPAGITRAPSHFLCCFLHLCNASQPSLSLSLSLSLSP